ICLRLFWLLARAAASRTFCTAGNSRPISTAMIAITTNSSIRVNALRARSLVRDITGTSNERKDQSAGEPVRPRNGDAEGAVVAVGGRVRRCGECEPHPAHPTGARPSPRSRAGTGGAAASGRVTVWRLGDARNIGKGGETESEKTWENRSADV